MKIKNFKINKKTASKLAACVLVGSLAATMLTGCSAGRDNILKGTILENSCVVTFADGSKDIAVAVGDCNGSEYHHYYSITSGEYFGDQKCTEAIFEGTVVHHYGITNEENITGYLTSDVLAKAMKGELNNDDIVSIVSRTINPIAEETNTKTR